MSVYSTRVVGAPNTLEHRIFIEKNGLPISAFHDIPLKADKAALQGVALNDDDQVFNMVIEIPRWSNAKVEISKDEVLNPIKQDIKKGQLRFVRNCFPHKGYIWNYGAIPQTWEDPNHRDEDTGEKGDNDPLDVCEIGEKVGYAGQVKQVKPLGIMALIDEGETDWKVIVIDVTDPLAKELNDIDDVERVLPGLIDATREWFRIYKKPDGKPENKFAFDGKAKNKEYALKVIKETNDAWIKLITAKEDTIKVTNLTVDNSPGKVPADHALIKAIPASSPLPAAPIDPSIDKWFYVSSNI
ncbi:Inorganic pyrophosphatase [Modicella reniformis]|uniref:Inorganic pyrophosphatase n=1 Tax=Modicella reniformis TaxID=1440133 RepID=A0A9P6LSJ4_9FUNG|nr:Inorganic pyrophosphatase [Modicella reniformis]